MNHIKKYQLFLESLVTKKLYHGSPYLFENFLPKTTYFSETKGFAEYYADDKSMAQGMDTETKLYTVEVKTDLFDINNKEDYDKLIPLLPEKIKYIYNNFGFEAEVDKEEFIMNLKGFAIEEPIENIDTIKVGETFPNPSYKTESYIVLKKTDDYICAVLERTWEDYTLGNLKKDNLFLSDKNKAHMLEYLVEAREYVMEISKSKWMSDDKVREKLAHLLDDSSKRYYTDVEVSEEEKSKFNELWSKAKERIIDTLCDYDRKPSNGFSNARKFITKPRKVELSETWRYYENETIADNIKKLGYGGYIAKERKTKTYAIFNPNQDVKILNINIEGLDFKDISEYNEFSKYLQEIYKGLKNEKALFINRWDVYKKHKEGLSVEDYIKTLK